MAEGLYVKLDVSYSDDEKIIAVGEKAEVLYVRSLCLAKRLLGDGFVSDAHLPRFHLPGWQARARALVREGLWKRDDQRGGYVIVAWPKWNRSAADVQAQREEASAQGVLGNHRRWHKTKRVPDCPHCIALGDRVPDRVPDTESPSSPRSPEAEAEAEAENSLLEPDGSQREDVDELCSILVTSMTERGLRTPTVNKQWRDAARLLLDRDEIPFDEAVRVLRWAVNDTFWAGNIQSLPKFRQQYDQLKVKSNVTPIRSRQVSNRDEWAFG